MVMVQVNGQPLVIDKGRLVLPADHAAPVTFKVLPFLSSGNSSKVRLR